MDFETAFSIAGMIVLPSWAVLILSPWRPPWFYLVVGRAVPALLSAGYAVLILRYFGGAEGGFGALADVKALLSTDGMLLAGWVHYLAFDLFVGAWLAERMSAHGINRLIQAPVLVATFMLGPIGFLIGWALLTPAANAKWESA